MMLTLLSSCNNIYQHSTPLPCREASKCLTITHTNAPGGCCNQQTAFIKNNNPDKDIYAIISVDTFLYVNGSPSFKRQYLLYIPSISSSAGQDLGCDTRKVLVNGDSICVESRLFTVKEACFEKSTNCSFNLPDNSDLPSANPLLSCNTVSWFQFNRQQRIEIKAFYSNILNSGSQTITANCDLVSLLFPWTTTKSMRIIFDKINIHSNGDGYMIQPMLSSAIKFLNTDQTIQKFWINIPNVLNAQISRGKTVDIDFVLSAPEHITIDMKLEPSGVIRTDILKRITIDPSNHTMYLSGDFLCFAISNID